MSHNLEYNKKNGTYSMFAVKKPAWHNLGQIVETAQTSEQAIKLANLDYFVEKYQNYVIATRDGVRHELISPDSFSTVRTDNLTVMGAVGKDYTVIQNTEAFDFFDAIVGEGKAIFETAGVLGRGEQIFISAKLPKSIVLDKVDLIEQYLLLSNSHDASRSIEVLFTPIRVVCNNTLNAALQMSKNRIKIRHTKSAKDKLREAHKLLGIHSELVYEQEKVFNLIKDRVITPDEFRNYVCNVFLDREERIALATVGIDKINTVPNISTRKLNTMNEVASYYISGPGQLLPTAKNTLWGAYNAITGYYQNVRTFSDEDKRMRSNLYGSNYNTMHEAYRLASQFADRELVLLTN